MSHLAKLPTLPEGWRWATVSSKNPETDEWSYAAKSKTEQVFELPGHFVIAIPTTPKAAKAGSGNRASFFDPIENEDITIEAGSYAADVAARIKHAAERVRGYFRGLAREGKSFTAADVQAMLLGQTLEPDPAEVTRLFESEGPEAVIAYMKRFGK